MMEGDSDSDSDEETPSHRKTTGRAARGSKARGSMAFSSSGSKAASSSASASKASSSSSSSSSSKAASSSSASPKSKSGWIEAATGGDDGRGGNLRGKDEDNFEPSDDEAEHAPTGRGRVSKPVNKADASRHKQSAGSRQPSARAGRLGDGSPGTKRRTA